MVEVQVIDDSTVTVAGATVTGPMHFFAPSVTVGITAVTEGYVLVVDDEATQPFGELMAYEAQAVDLVVFGSIMCGIWLAKALFK